MDTTSNNNLFVKEAYSRGQYKIFTIHGSQDAVDAYIASYGNTKLPVSQSGDHLCFIADLTKVPEAGLLKTWTLRSYERKDGSTGFVLDLDAYRASIAITATLPPAIGAVLVKEAMEMLKTGVDIPAEYQQPISLATATTIVAIPQPTGAADLDAIFKDTPDGIAQG